MGGTSYIEQDNIYRGTGPLLAAVTPSGERHFHVDHLGTPRLITDASGAQVAFHAYYPYGEEATEVDQDTLRYKFAGHERDLVDPSSGADDLDHMHARMSNPQLGRLLSTDPELQVERAKERPQLWNRYAYAVGNPVLYVDRDGKAIETAWDAVNVGVGVASLLANIAAGNVGGAVIDAGGLALDLGATAVPFVPGGASTAIKAARLAENVKFGKAFEKAVLGALKLEKNTSVVPSITGAAYRIPDAFASGILLEIKGVKKLEYTDQVKDFVAAATRDHQKLVIAITEETKISKPLLALAEEGKIFFLRYKRDFL